MLKGPGLSDPGLRWRNPIADHRDGECFLPRPCPRLLGCLGNPDQSPTAHTPGSLDTTRKHVYIDQKAL